MSSIFLIIYLLVIRFYGFMHPVPVSEDGGVLYLLLVHLIGKNALVFSILGAAVAFINALLLNQLVFNQRIGYHRDYFVALIYILLSGSLWRFQTLSPYLAGSVFILLAINRLFGLSKEFEKRETDYYVGMLIGVAGLFSPYYFIFIFPALLSMFLFGTFRLKEISALLLGWINPVLIVGVGYFMLGQFDFFIETTFSFDYAVYLLFIKWDWAVYGVLLVFVLLFALSVFIQPLLMVKQQHLAKKYIRVVYNFLFVSFGSLLFLELNNFSYLFLIILFLSFIFGVYFKRKNGEVTLSMELFHLVFFMLVMLNQYKFHLG